MSCGGGSRHGHMQAVYEAGGVRGEQCTYIAGSCLCRGGAGREVQVVAKMRGLRRRQAVEGVIANHTPSLGLHVGSLRYHGSLQLNAGHHSRKSVHLLHLNLHSQHTAQSTVLAALQISLNTKVPSHCAGVLLHTVPFPHSLCQLVLVGVVWAAGEAALEPCTLVPESAVSTG